MTNIFAENKDILKILLSKIVGLNLKGNILKILEFSVDPKALTVQQYHCSVLFMETFSL